MIDRLPALIQEHEEDGVGQLILALIGEAIEPLLHRYPLSVLMRRSIDRLTDEIKEELTLDFAEHLIDGRLTEAFAHASSERHLLFLLRLRARQFLQNRMRGGERENLAARAQRLLKTDGRFVSEERAELRWQLRGAVGGPYTGTDADLRRLARRLPIPPSVSRRRRNTEIASAVLNEIDLADLIRRALEEVGGSLTLQQLRVIIDERLGLVPTETVSIYRRVGGEPPLEDVLESETSDIERTHLRLIASDVVEELSQRQLRILRLRFHDGLNREETAAALNVSHGTIDNELARIGDIVLSATDQDHPAAREVIRLLTDPAGD